MTPYMIYSDSPPKKIIILSSFTSLVPLNLLGFLLWSRREDALKNIGNQIILDPIDFQCKDKKKQKKTLIYFSKCIVFEQQGWVNDDRMIIFWVKYPFNSLF